MSYKITVYGLIKSTFNVLERKKKGQSGYGGEGNRWEIKQNINFYHVIKVSIFYHVIIFSF